VTPAQRHTGLDAALLRKRAAVYQVARTAHPERWSGDARNWEPVSIVHLNPEQTSGNAAAIEEQTQLKKAA